MRSRFNVLFFLAPRRREDDVNITVKNETVPRSNVLVNVFRTAHSQKNVEVINKALGYDLRIGEASIF